MVTVFSSLFKDERTILQAFRFREVSSSLSPLEGIDLLNEIKRDQYVPPPGTKNFDLHFGTNHVVHEHATLFGGKPCPFVSNGPPSMTSSRKAFLARAENKLFKGNIQKC